MLKSRKLLSIITIFSLFGQIQLFAQNKNDFSKASVSIKYHNRAIYYPGNSADNPINVHITIKNEGTETLRFKLADDRMFSLDFNAFTVKNTRLPNTENLIEKRTSNTTVYFREIALEQGEEYSFIENLKDYINIENPSVYYLEMSFYPELYKSKFISINSNRLTLEVRPSPSAVSSSYIPVSAQEYQFRQEQAF